MRKEHALAGSGRSRPNRQPLLLYSLYSGQSGLQVSLQILFATFKFSARNLRLFHTFPYFSILFSLLSARCLFATHYFELCHLQAGSRTVQHWCPLLSQGGTRWDKVEEPGGFYTDSTPTQDCLRLLTSRC